MTAEEPACFLSLCRERLSGDDWDIRAHDPWIHLAPPDVGVLPDQGWKLHVSSSLHSARLVLHRVLSILKANPCHFKLTLNETVLRSLNMGTLGATQIGKFITIYPRNDGEAVQIATLIDAASTGLQGPRIPSDHRFRPASIVYYRYGSFAPFQTRSPIGEYVRMMRDPDGRPIPDHVSLWPQKTAPVANPFRPDNDVDIDDEALKLNRFGIYVPLKALTTSAKGTVFLALDTSGLRRCILKQSYRDIPLGFDSDAIAYLKREADTLLALERSGVTPRLYDFTDQADYSFLVMEDFPYRTMEQFCSNSEPASPDGSLDSWQIAQALSDAVAAVHRFGYVHGDLKTANILVSDDFQVKLVDLELALPVGSMRVDNRGTRGYLSHSAVASSIVAVSDDIYAIGSVLLYLSTGHEPSATVFASPLNDPRFDPSMAAIPDLYAIGVACLRGDIATVDELSATVRRARQTESAVAGRNLCVNELFIGDEVCREEDIMLAIDRVARALCRTASKILQQHRSHTMSTDLNDGLSGLLTGLLLVPDTVHDFRLARDLAGCIADFLISALSSPTVALPGLFVGDMGAAVALTSAGHALANDHYRLKAHEFAIRSTDVSLANPDLFHGMAGRLMGLLCLSQHSNCSGFRGFANDDHQRLRAASIKDDNGAICFEIPDGYSGLSNKRFLGLAHGSAGVGLAIARGIRWGVLEQDDTLVREIRDTLLNVQTRRPTGTLSWPVEVGQNEETGPFWCHGVGGITQFLIESDLILRDDVNLKWIERCIETLGRSGWLFGLDLCHGTAGSVETLALARDFGHLKADRAMAAYLQCCNVFLRQLNSSSDDSLEVQEQCGLMIGHPGALYALRRISNSHRISSIWNYFAGYPSQPAMEAAPLRSG